MLKLRVVVVVLCLSFVVVCVCCFVSQWRSILGSVLEA